MHYAEASVSITGHDLTHIAAPSQSIVATKDNKPNAGERIAFPRDVDVVGTRRRTWSQHPGNVYYRQLVSKTLDELLEKNDDGIPMKYWATKVVDHIMKERDAVFLKADEQNGHWHVMDYAAAVNKSAVALRNAEIKKRPGSAVGGGGGKKKAGGKRKSAGGGGGAKKMSASGPESMTLVPVPNPTASYHVQDLPPIQYKEGSPPEKKIYRCVFEAKEGTAMPLDPYAKAIINFMCSQIDAKSAARALDVPIKSIYKSFAEEPDKERLFRLQLRQRYIAAMTIGMSPVFFSKKLMELWGGSITERKIRIDKDGNVIFEEPPPVPEDAAATNLAKGNPLKETANTEKEEKTGIATPPDPTLSTTTAENLNKQTDTEGNTLGTNKDFVMTEATDPANGTSNQAESLTAPMKVEAGKSHKNVVHSDMPSIAPKAEPIMVEGTSIPKREEVPGTAKMAMIPTKPTQSMIGKEAKPQIERHVITGMSAKAASAEKDGTKNRSKEVANAKETEPATMTTMKAEKTEEHASDRLLIKETPAEPTTMDLVGETQAIGTRNEINVKQEETAAVKKEDRDGLHCEEQGVESEATNKSSHERVKIENLTMTRDSAHADSVDAGGKLECVTLVNETEQSKEKERCVEKGGHQVSGIAPGQHQENVKVKVEEKLPGKVEEK